MGDTVVLVCAGTQYELSRTRYAEEALSPRSFQSQQVRGTRGSAVGSLLGTRYEQGTQREEPVLCSVLRTRMAYAYEYPSPTVVC